MLITIVRNKISLAFSAFLAYAALTCAQGIPSQAGVGITEHLNEFLPEEITVINEAGQAVQLTSIIDKPTVISLVYFRCPGICSPLMSGLADVIDQTDMQIGEEYQAFTISFDPREDTKLAVSKKSNYINTMQDTTVADGWLFFTADSQNVSVLTSALGFDYKRQGNDFLHAAALMVVSPNGKITRYLNGTYFLPFEFKMALIEAADGKVGPTINKVLQLCFSYDPAGQQYVLNITRVAGSLIILLGVIFFLILVMRPAIRKKDKSVK